MATEARVRSLDALESFRSSLIVDLTKASVLEHVTIGQYAEEIALDDTGTVGVVGYSTDGSVRTFGVGGLFGYFGRFRSPRFGPYQLYATRRAPSVQLRARGGTYVLSPDAPEAFLAEVQRHLGVLPRS